jgi:ribosomal protein L12E/L44/L45/RPP1/RPP2
MARENSDRRVDDNRCVGRRTQFANPSAGAAADAADASPRRNRDDERTEHYDDDESRDDGGSDAILRGA